jgi:hypothetical protein
MRTDAQLGKRPNSYGAESHWKDWGIGEPLQFTTLGGGSDNYLPQFLAVLTCLGGLGTFCRTPNIGNITLQSDIRGFGFEDLGMDGKITLKWAPKK